MVAVDGRGSDLSVSQEIGASLLVTHGCVLDKPQGRASDAPPRIQWLQFLPIRDLGAQDEERQRVARANRVDPSEVMYVDRDVPGVGEGYCLLSEMYSLPASYFAPDLQSFASHPEAEPGARYLVATRRNSRAGRISDEQVELLGWKMAKFWPRLEAPAD